MVEILIESKRNINGSELQFLVVGISCLVELGMKEVEKYVY